MKGAEPRNFEQHREMVLPEFDIRASMPDGKALNLRDVKVADLASMPVKSRAAIGSAIEDLNILDRLGHHDNLLGEIRRLGDDAPRVAVREKAGYVPRSQEVDEYAPNYLGEVDLGEAPALDPKMNVHASDIDKLQADLLQNWDTLPVLTRIGDMFTSALRGLHNLLYIVVGSHQRSSITLSTNATLRDINKLNAKIEATRGNLLIKK